jgi:MtN3 and saliva related transmembrane protein
MSLHELIGYLAAFLTTCSFVPQAWHTSSQTPSPWR